MKFISHRGNLSGPISSEENNPEKIKHCLSLGYDVEIDIWNVNEKFYLGHDEPNHEVSLEFLVNKSLWCHAKNLQSLHSMLQVKNINCFWHQNDDYTLTSHGYIWVFPNKPLIKNCIALIGNNTLYSEKELQECYAICGDSVEKYLKVYGKSKKN